MKQDFINDFANNEQPVSKIVIAVKLPSKATEIIINTEEIRTKFDYYCNAYDENLCLKSNADIQIMRWFFV